MQEVFEAWWRGAHLPTSVAGYRPAPGLRWAHPAEDEEAVARYLSHPRIRAYAPRIGAHDVREREERSRERQTMELEKAQWEDERSDSEPGEDLA